MNDLLRTKGGTDVKQEDSNTPSCAIKQETSPSAVIDALRRGSFRSTGDDRQTLQSMFDSVKQKQRGPFELLLKDVLGNTGSFSDYLDSGNEKRRAHIGHLLVTDSFLIECDV